jgi:hypothetical protein
MHCKPPKPVFVPARDVLLAFSLRILRITKNMVSAGTVLSKRNRGCRPSSVRDPVRTMRLSDDFINQIDHWASQQEHQPGRSRSHPRLVELGLKKGK